MTRFAPFSRSASIVSVVLLAIALTCATAQAVAAMARPALIPAPASLTPAKGGFDVDADTLVHASGPQALAAARQFVELVEKSGHGKLKIVERARSDAPGIVFAIEQASSSSTSPEAYALNVMPQGSASPPMTSADCSTVR